MAPRALDLAPDREHIHHCLKSRLRSAVATLVAAVFLATLGAVGAVLNQTYGMGDLVACVVVVLSVGLLVGTNTFGAVEWRLLVFRLKVALRLFTRATPLEDEGSARSVTFAVAGTGRRSGTPWSAQPRCMESGESSWRSK